MRKFIWLFMCTIMTTACFSLPTDPVSGDDDKTKVTKSRTKVAIMGICQNFKIEGETGDNPTVTFQCLPDEHIVCASYDNGTMEVNCDQENSINYQDLHINNVGGGVKEITLVGCSFN